MTVERLFNYVLSICVIMKVVYNCSPTSQSSSPSVTTTTAFPCGSCPTTLPIIPFTGSDPTTAVTFSTQTTDVNGCAALLVTCTHSTAGQMLLIGNDVNGNGCTLASMLASAVTSVMTTLYCNSAGQWTQVGPNNGPTCAGGANNGTNFVTPIFNVSCLAVAGTG